MDGAEKKVGCLGARHHSRRLRANYASSSVANCCLGASVDALKTTGLTSVQQKSFILYMHPAITPQPMTNRRSGTQHM